MVSKRPKGLPSRKQLRDTKQRQRNQRIGIVLGVAILAFAVDRYFHTETTAVYQADTVRTPLTQQVSCTEDSNALSYVPFVTSTRTPASVCQSAQCGRFLSDAVVSQNDAVILRKFASTLMDKYGGGSGGPTILDLHTGALSYGSKFVDVYHTLRANGESIEHDHALKTYRSAKASIKRAVERHFGVRGIGLTKPTFFSRINSTEAKTSHDEYWHSHIDKVTYGTFEYTCLLYLTDYGVDFQGGRFVFEDKSYRGGVVDTIVEPKLGRVSCFTSGDENPHHVEQVTDGTRFALTIAFTCDEEHMISEPDGKLLIEESGQSKQKHS
eukprot:m.351641 g.351641  ORF g.351641 m.351641 type:complete len:325 (-) comp16299_c0_seq1:38-1012(-)